MHELPIMKKILSTINNYSELSETKRLVSVNLKVGALRDLVPEWVQKYWDYITRGTYAEGSRVNIEVIPVTFECRKCGAVFEYNIFSEEDPECAACGSGETNLKTGNELFIDEVEVKTIT